ncbi:protein of unknown function [Rhodovastum atsumiense]|nr:periplasmic heavy metal sensor [Rhodovastum atsumiense]CAH2603143.1 protein of unknown function [Rhodovastum atsumiense]
MRPRSSVVLAVLLGASLALNVVLGGMMLRRGAEPPPDPGRLQARIESLLSPADRAAFHAAMQPVAPDLAQFRRTLREQGATIKAALEQDSFDAEAQRERMAAHRQNWATFSLRFDDALSRAMAAISPEGRRRIAADMPAPPPEDSDRSRP